MLLMKMNANLPNFIIVGPINYGIQRTNIGNLNKNLSFISNYIN